MKKEIEGYPGYEVDTNGVFYSYRISMGRAGIRLSDKAKVIKGSLGKNGYLIHNLGKLDSSDRERFYAHRLVYETFKGKIPKNMVVRHLNDIRTDNKLENLAIGTQKENIEDCLKNGNLAVGEKRWNSKFTEREIKEIRRLHKEKNMSFVEISRIFNCHSSTISLIARELTWKHVK